MAERDFWAPYRDDPEHMEAYAIASLQFDVCELILKTMEEREVSRSDLARRLGVTRGAVTSMLHGGNLTLATVARAFHVLGVKISIEAEVAKSP